MTEAESASLMDWATARLAQLVDAACAEIAAQIPLYRETSLISADELHRSIEHNIRLLISALEHPERELDPSIPQETGRRRAHQGVPLPEVLQAYRISFATLWQTLVDYARRRSHGRMTQTLLTTASTLWQLADAHALALTEAYRAATAEMLLTQQQRRAALVEVLLSGRPGANATPWDAAAQLHFAPDSALAVVAAQTRGLAEESMPSIESRLLDEGLVSAWRLTPALQIGVVSIDEEHVGDLLRTLTLHATTRTGVSSLYRSPADTPRALRLARSALAAIARDDTDVRMFDPSPLAAMVAADPRESTRLVSDVLGAVLGLPHDERAVLLDTLAAYLDNAGSATRAGELLHCHPNTVRYRLRRVQDLTGRSFQDPAQLAEIATAVRAHHLLSAAA